MKLLLLAAGKSNRIYKKIKKNKCLIRYNNTSLLEKIIIDSNLKNINDINIVVGFNKNLIKKKLKKLNINYIENDFYNSTDMLYSLYLGLKSLDDDTIISYSDIIFSKKIFSDIKKISKNKEIIIPINSKWKNIWKIRKKNIFDDCETLSFNKNFKLTEIGNKIDNPRKVKGQYMGIIYISKKKLPLIIKYLKLHLKKNKTSHITYFLNSIKDRLNIYCMRTSTFWYEIDDFQDYKNLKNLKW